MAVHPTAVVHETASLGDVEIGPYAVIGEGVTLADGVAVGPHAVIRGVTSIGVNTVVDAHAVLGGEAQDDRHEQGSGTRLEIGSGNTIREFCTIHVGSSAGRGLTRIGDDCVLMSHSHVAGDADIGSGATLSSGAMLAGNVDIGAGAVLGVGAAVHQYCRIGRLAMVGQGSMCTQDVPPFSLAQGDRARLFGLHVVGLKRSGLPPETVGALKDAWRLLFTEGLPIRAAMARVQRRDIAEVQELVDFVSSTKRGIARSVGRG